MADQRRGLGSLEPKPLKPGEYVGDYTAAMRLVQDFMPHPRVDGLLHALHAERPVLLDSSLHTAAEIPHRIAFTSDEEHG